MSLKTATLLVIIGQVLSFAAQTTFRYYPASLNELSVDLMKNFYHVAYTLDKASLLLFLGVLYSKQK